MPLVQGPFFEVTNPIQISQFTPREPGGLRRWNWGHTAATDLDLESRAWHPVQRCFHYIARTSGKEKWEIIHVVLCIEKIWRAATENNFIFQRCVSEIVILWSIDAMLFSFSLFFSLFCTYTLISNLSSIPFNSLPIIIWIQMIKLTLFYVK